MSGLGERIGAGAGSGAGSGLAASSSLDPVSSAAATYRLTLVAISAFVVQHCLLPGLQIHGARADLMLLVVVVTALEVGPRRGALCGFAVGLVVDLFVTTPFGLSALTFTLVGYAVGLAKGVLAGAEGPSITIGVAAAASAAATILYALLLAIMGGSTVGLVWIVLTVALVNAIFALPMARLVRWATGHGATSGGSRGRTPVAGSWRGLGDGAGSWRGRPGAGAWR